MRSRDGEGWAFVAGVVAAVAAWFYWHDVALLFGAFVGVGTIVGVGIVLYSWPGRESHGAFTPPDRKKEP